MNAARILSSIVFIGFYFASMAFLSFASAFSSFRGSSNPNVGYGDVASNAIAALAIVTFIPTILLWIPYRVALVIGGIILAVPLVLMIAMVKAVGAGAIIALLPFALWAYTASLCWKHISREATAKKEAQAYL